MKSKSGIEDEFFAGVLFLFPKLWTMQFSPYMKIDGNQQVLFANSAFRSLCFKICVVFGADIFSPLQQGAPCYVMVIFVSEVLHCLDFFLSTFEVGLAYQ